MSRIARGVDLLLDPTNLINAVYALVHIESIWSVGSDEHMGIHVFSVTDWVRILARCSESMFPAEVNAVKEWRR
jgi:hypothetical protein